MSDEPTILVEFSMSPLGKGESVSPYVARALDIIDNSGLDYELHSLGTIIEGQWSEVMEVLKQCHQAMEKNCDRITTTMKMDYRAGASGRIQGKVSSVEDKVGRKLQTQKE
ncbi:MAG: MTH1187 family thiamine-binding protein [Candidatus Marinimicrobia bacterium]|nr:MTH1187 family thiamine-binding protein [Candidatus Neomarinimicrobiota bacterium]MCF7829223.1 MTH1187 family thiamine-binding protein [Candidatus Neomarinimicrobiota bacterium]MCF7881124.1 MTH1187 family thiamine-binding protein [Candidatus Neomarinimicrobiota bacterium]